MKSAPRIGFTLDYEEGGAPPAYSRMPFYALRENYCASVSALGALPFGLPHEVELAEQYLDLIDGLIITGGAFDVSPALYGDASQHATVITKDRRTTFELAMTRGALARKLPILGICGGQQLLNVVLGGTLIQHIPDTIPNALAHEQPNPRTKPGHMVAITPGTLLARILSPSPFRGEAGRGAQHATSSQVSPHPNPPPMGEGISGEGTLTIQVNSAHHQAVATPAPTVIVNAVAPDGVIEGIELPESEHPFCLGVQWHPEYHVTEADTRIFAAFIKSSQSCKMILQNA